MAFMASMSFSALHLGGKHLRSSLTSTQVSADGSRTVSATEHENEESHSHPYAHGVDGSRTLTGGHENDRGSSGFNSDVERLGHGLKAGIDRLRSK